MPVPGYSDSLCMRWKAPNSFWAKAMSKPTHYRARRTPAAFYFSPAEFDTRRWAPAGKFPGIAEQVGQYNLDQPGSPRAPGRVWITSSTCRPGCSARSRFVTFGKHAEIDAPGLHVAARHARKLQQVIDQLAHALGFGAYGIQVVARLRIELVVIILQQGRLQPSMPRSGRAGRAKPSKQRLPVLCWRLPIEPCAGAHVVPNPG